MAVLLPKLAPWNFTPTTGDADPPIFRLRPLTQPQIIELEESYKDGRPTAGTWYKAGQMAIASVSNLLDEKGEEAKWPHCQNRVPRAWVAEAGAEAWLKSNGFDVDEELEKN
jgi:hypothetical protein